MKIFQEKNARCCLGNKIILSLHTFFTSPCDGELGNTMINN